LSRLIHTWPFRDWSHTHRGLSSRPDDGIVVMDPRTFGLTEDWDVCEPQYGIQRLRREYEVFVDRLSTLAHASATKTKCAKIKRVKASLLTPVFTVNTSLYEGIDDAKVTDGDVDEAQATDGDVDDDQANEGAADDDKTNEGAADDDKANEG
jgi:hypothetical protein